MGEKLCKGVMIDRRRFMEGVTMKGARADNSMDVGVEIQGLSTCLDNEHCPRGSRRYHLVKLKDGFPGSFEQDFAKVPVVLKEHPDSFRQREHDMPVRDWL